jgi:hypothetical protein
MRTYSGRGHPPIGQVQMALPLVKKFGPQEVRRVAITTTALANCQSNGLACESIVMSAQMLQLPDRPVVVSAAFTAPSVRRGYHPNAHVTGCVNVNGRHSDYWQPPKERQ